MGILGLGVKMCAKQKKSASCLFYLYLFFNFGAIHAERPLPLQEGQLVPLQIQETKQVQETKIINKPVEQKTSSKKIFLRKVLTKSLLVGLLLATYFATANAKQSGYMLQQLKPQDLVKNFIETFLTNSLISTGHELGHALTAKFFNGDKIDIHLGTSNPSAKALAKIGGISIDGLSPISGYSNFSENYNNLNQIRLELIKNFCEHHNLDPNKLTMQDIDEMIASPEAEQAKEKLKLCKSKKLAILAAGTLFGLLTNYLIRFVKIYIQSKADLTMGQHIKNTAISALWPDEQSVLQLSNLLLPSDNNDSAKILKTCFNATDATIEELNEISYIAHIAATTGIRYINEPADSPGTLHTKLITGLINHMLLGYLKFKS